MKKVRIPQKPEDYFYIFANFAKEHLNIDVKTEEDIKRVLPTFVKNIDQSKINTNLMEFLVNVGYDGKLGSNTNPLLDGKFTPTPLQEFYKVYVDRENLKKEVETLRLENQTLKDKPATSQEPESKNIKNILKSLFQRIFKKKESVPQLPAPTHQSKNFQEELKSPSQEYLEKLRTDLLKNPNVLEECITSYAMVEPDKMIDLSPNADIADIAQPQIEERPFGDRF